MLRIERYQKGRYWAIYESQALGVVTVYKRGAQEVLRRLQALAARPCTGAPPSARQRKACS